MPPLKSPTYDLPRLAIASELAPLQRLFCDAEQEVGLKPEVCRPENSERLRGWFEAKLDADCIWTTDGAKSLLVLNRDLLGQPEEVFYVVVAPELRGRHIGRRLVANIQAQSSALVAEARSKASRSMLIACGFDDQNRKRAGFPLLQWSYNNHE